MRVICAAGGGNVRVRGGSSVAPASLVLAVDPAAGGCPICTAHAKWVTAHTTQEQLQQRELKEQQQQEREHWLQERGAKWEQREQQQRELREQQQREPKEQQQRELKEQQQRELKPLPPNGSKWILRGIGPWQGRTTATLRSPLFQSCLTGIALIVALWWR